MASRARARGSAGGSRDHRRGRPPDPRDRRYQGRYGALDNRCPHQGGPLGEGAIENGWLRCPCAAGTTGPHSGNSPGGFDDGVASFPVEVRDDGVYVSRSASARVPPRSQTWWPRRWQTGLHNPDFSRYARLCGALGIRVTEASALDAALARARAHDGPALVEVTADAELV